MICGSRKLQREKLQTFRAGSPNRLTADQTRLKTKAKAGSVSKHRNGSYMHTLRSRVRSNRKRHMLAIGILNGFRIVDCPDLLLGLVDKDRLLAALDTLLGAGRARSSVLGAAHGVGNIAINLGGIRGKGRNGSKGQERKSNYRSTLHEFSPLLE